MKKLFFLSLVLSQFAAVQLVNADALGNLKKSAAKVTNDSKAAATEAGTKVQGSAAAAKQDAQGQTENASSGAANTQSTASSAKQKAKDAAMDKTSAHRAKGTMMKKKMKNKKDAAAAHAAEKATAVGQ